MKNVKLLDCTLRDGGRIIDCKFTDSEITKICSQLGNAHIDIIEVGFLRDWKNISYKGNSTFFTDTTQISRFIDKKNTNSLFVAFIDFGMFDFDSLKEYDGSSIDGIRFGFTKNNYLNEKSKIIEYSKKIKDYGYKLFIQGVNTLSYSDKELLELVDLMNEIKPYSFGIVDTYGAMYVDDVSRIFGLVNHNLSTEICIDFHSHNNYQLSFALAQEIIKLSHGNRQIIIDGTLLGMGKLAGNLNIELIAEYLIKKCGYNYDLDILLDLIDENISKYHQHHSWGYSIPAMMSGLYKSHPNNVIYLLEKFRIDSKDIGNILSKIDPVTRQRYDYDNIKKIYIEYMSSKVDDSNTLMLLKQVFMNSEILILAPGPSLKECENDIDNFISNNEVKIINVNFISKYKNSYSFITNQKRFNQINNKMENMILTSNVEHKCNAYVVNYQSIIYNDSVYFDNSTIMLLNLLKKILPKKIYIAGFDGFFDYKNNFFTEALDNNFNKKDYEIINKETARMFSNIRESIVDKCKIEFLTNSIYDI